MKRLFKVSFLLFIFFLLTACEDKEYKLIELTSTDLSKLLTEGNDSFVFATINVRNDENANKFKKALQKYVIEGKTTIYYLDSSDLLFMDDETIYSQTNIDLSKQYLYLVREGRIKLAARFEGEDTLRKNLVSIHYDEIELPTKDSEKKEYLKQAKKLYEQGFICSSYQNLQKAWTLEAAKKYYRDHNYYNIINYWRAFVHLDDNTALSKEIVIFSVEDSINSFYYKGPKKKYSYPKSNDYDVKDFYIKDNFIYTSETGKEKYKKQYEIIELTKDYFKVEENGIVYHLHPFSYDDINNEE